MKEFYSEETTGPSLRELEEFASWYNEKIGNYPIIVGGWAVYCYTGGLGSKDIDAVFLGDQVKHGTLFPYFAAHGYAEHKKNWFETEWTKVIEKNNSEFEIVIDAVSSLPAKRAKIGSSRKNAGKTAPAAQGIIV